MRVGIGYDVHPLVSGRRLVLGGVEIPFNDGPGRHWHPFSFVRSALQGCLQRFAASAGHFVAAGSRMASVQR
jgi:hypothetical protein